jgi:hypothetical protein
MIIEFIETQYAQFFSESGTKCTLPGACETKTFLIDTAKIPAFLETQTNSYQRMLYVGPMIQHAQRGVRALEVPLYNSFSDMPEWYQALLADDGATPECTVFVEIVFDEIS